MGLFEQLHMHKKATALLTVAFLCAIGGIVYAISNPVPNQLDQSSNSSAPVSSSVKVKVANISPAGSAAPSTASSTQSAQKIGIGQSTFQDEAKYKPVTGQPQKKTSENNSRTAGTQSNAPNGSTITDITVPDHINLTVGEGLPISIEISPETALDKKVIWKSSDENIATVDKTGMVTAVAAGSCSITVCAATDKVQSSVAVSVVKDDSNH